MDINQLYTAAIDKWGIDNQIIVAIEEAAEFQKELTRKLRNGTDNSQFDSLLADEMADLSIMIEQVTAMFNLKKDVEKSRRYKLNRLAERIGCRSEFNAHHLEKEKLIHSIMGCTSPHLKSENVCFNRLKRTKYSNCIKLIKGYATKSTQVIDPIELEKLLISELEEIYLILSKKI